MIRKSLLLVFSIFVVLSCSVPLLAQESWEWVSFTGQQEIFTYEITHYSESGIETQGNMLEWKTSSICILIFKN